MRRTTTCFIAAGMLATLFAPPARPQSPPAPSSPAAEQVQTGGRIHGVVKGGNVPLPGVTVTAQNTLTGKRYSTTTDISGTWALTIPQNGRYVVRTQFAAFAPGSEEAVLNAASHEQSLAFDLILASRAAEQQAKESAQSNSSLDATAAQAIRQLVAGGAQSLSLMSSLSSDTETQSASAPSASAQGASLPSIAGNSDFANDSVAISGQSGQVSPLAGLDLDRIRDAIETARAQGGLPGGAGSGLLGGSGGGFGGQGGGFGGGSGFGGGPGFGGGGFGGGFPGGGRGNFRGFNPGRPHGAIFWAGSNSALNAAPFSCKASNKINPPPEPTASASPLCPRRIFRDSPSPAGKTPSS